MGTYVVNPISKTKRFIHWACELIISFFFGFILVSFASIPLGKIIMHVDDQKTLLTTQSGKRLDILYGNKLLFYNTVEEKNNFDTSFLATFDKYLSNYVVAINPEYEVFYHFYNDIRNDSKTYYSLYNTINTNNPFFDINDNKIVMKDYYVTLFAPYFSKTDILSDEGKKQLEVFQNRVYTQLYSEMISNIASKDLTYEGMSYVQISKEMNNITNTINYTYVWSTYIGYFLGLACVFIIVPLINKDHKTITSLFLKNTRINSRSFALMRKRDIFLGYFYSILLYSGLLFLSPVMHIGFANALALPTLFVVSFISLLFVLISFIYSFISDSGCTLSDYLTRTILVADATIDELESIEKKEKDGREDRDNL